MNKIQHRRRTSRLVHSYKRPCPGFTLIELMVVILIVGLISAISIPKLIPLIAFSALEGNARRLANYGRVVSAQASFTGERHVVRFNLDEDPQCYYTVHWVLPSEKKAEETAEAAGMAAQVMSPSGGLDELFESQGEDSSLAMLAVAFPEMAQKAKSYEDEEVDLYLTNRAIDPSILEPEEFEEIRVRMAIDEEFDGFQRGRLESRAKNVLPPEELTDSGGIFGSDDDFDVDEDDPVEEEVTDTILQRHKMPEEVIIHSVSVEGDKISSGVAEVEIGPLGMTQYVVIELVSSDGEWFTVTWDPAAGMTKWKAGTSDD